MSTSRQPCLGNEGGDGADDASREKVSPNRRYLASERSLFSFQKHAMGEDVQGHLVAATTAQAAGAHSTALERCSTHWRSTTRRCQRTASALSAVQRSSEGPLHRHGYRLYRFPVTVSRGLQGRHLQTLGPHHRSHYRCFRPGGESYQNDGASATNKEKELECNEVRL